MSLQTPAGVKPFIARIDPALTDQDALLTTLIAGAEAAAAWYCGWTPLAAGTPCTMASNSRTLWTHRGLAKVRRLDSRRLRLPLWPVTTITSVHQSTAWTWDSGALVGAGDYVLDGDEGLLVLKSGAALTDGWSPDFGAVRVIAVAGFGDSAGIATDDLLAEALALAVAHRYNTLAHLGEQSRSVAGASQSFRAEFLPESVRGLLTPYRLPRAPRWPTNREAAAAKRAAAASEGR